MIIWFFGSIGLALYYVWLIYKIYDSWTLSKDWSIPEEYVASTSVTVIVAARNEESNIRNTILSIVENKYPENLFEILVINDHSEDGTNSVLQDLRSKNVRVIDLPDGLTGKKNALAYGINQSKGELIIVTDADCLVPTNWISSITSFYDANSVQFIASPVVFSNDQSLLGKLQILDLTGMMGVTHAGIALKEWYMANGANMAFEKSAFLDNNGFQDNKQWASGDDMFLIQSIAQKDSAKVAFLKSPEAVTTQPLRHWVKFKDQRLRWATKNKSMEHGGIQKTLGIVFLFSLSILINLLLIPILGGFFFLIFLFQLFLKLTIDYLYLHQLTSYFRQEKAMKHYLIVSIIYIFYVVGVGIASLFVKQYSWKGRVVK